MSPEVYEMLFCNIEEIQRKLAEEAKKDFLRDSDESNYTTHYVDPKADRVLAQYLRIPPLESSGYFLMVAKDQSHAMLLDFILGLENGGLVVKVVVPGNKVGKLLEAFQAFILEAGYAFV